MEESERERALLDLLFGQSTRFFFFLCSVPFLFLLFSGITFSLFHIFPFYHEQFFLGLLLPSFYFMLVCLVPSFYYLVKELKKEKENLFFLVLSFFLETFSFFLLRSSSLGKKIIKKSSSLKTYILRFEKERV